MFNINDIIIVANIRYINNNLILYRHVCKQQNCGYEISYRKCNNKHNYSIFIYYNSTDSKN